MPEIPEELVHKITLMAYQLNPHPLAKLTHLKNNFINKTEKDLMKLWKQTNPRRGETWAEDEFEDRFLDSDVFEKYWMSVYEEDKTSEKYLDVINWWLMEERIDLFDDEYIDRIHWFMRELFISLYWEYHNEHK